MVCNDGTYWDTNDGDDYGTPAGENHSENDPSLEISLPEPVIEVPLVELVKETSTTEQL